MCYGGRRLASGGFLFVFCLVLFGLPPTPHYSSVRGLLASQLQGSSSYPPGFPRSTVSASSPHNGSRGLNSGPDACSAHVLPTEPSPQLLKTNVFVLSGFFLKRDRNHGAWKLMFLKSHYLVSFLFRLLSLRFFWTLALRGS